MTIEGNEQYYARRVEQELGLASATLDPAAKAIHLNLAARYATLRERAVRLMRDPSTV
ncbi:hypothetical protein IFT82_16215 [Sphingomonas sp. CFBP 8760]|nr:hypothetical protein [Sphingomonas sp. CFBP 8760]